MSLDGHGARSIWTLAQGEREERTAPTGSGSEGRLKPARGKRDGGTHSLASRGRLPLKRAGRFFPLHLFSMAANAEFAAEKTLNQSLK